MSARVTERPATLEELAWLVADAVESGRGWARAAEVVAWLERLAGAELGPVAGEPAVVLARRFARAERLLRNRPEQLAALGSGTATVRVPPAGQVAAPLAA